MNIEVKLKLRLRFLNVKKDWLVVIDYKCICFVFNDSELVYDYIIVSGMFLRVFELVFLLSSWL